MKFKIINNINKEPITFNSKQITMYLCGPTVYNHVHIGNIRPIITFDVLNRLLLTLGYKVNFVHNITDIDDKIIKQAILEKKLETEISNFYYHQYLQILKQLNVDFKKIHIYKVTDNIDSIINYIDEIVKKDFAYESNGDIYFSIQKITNYGHLSNKTLDELLIGARVQVNSEKKNENDFVLWKKTKEGITWKSSWSNGRPGWHTECSCLINKYIGKQVDIHGGGIDLKFPHHENENAQNIAINNKELAKSWLHVGHLTIMEEKMSKSLNNFILAKDLLQQNDANSIRWFFYKTVYSNPINYSSELIKDASNEINSIINNLNVFKSYLYINKSFKLNNKKYYDCLSNLIDNLNFPNHISLILQLLKEANLLLRNKQWKELNVLYNKIFFSLSILGIEMKNIHTKKNIELLLEWNKEKNKNNFKLSDKLREKLLIKKLI